MTDKEKIREEVERLRKLHQMKYQQLDADSSMSLVECGKRNLCNELLSFIDSIQSEEDDDDAWLNDIISKAECNLQLNKGEIDWLKSLRHQSQWKPTKEQMEALKSSTYCQNEQMSKVLFELYQDLKKLREEL